VTLGLGILEAGSAGRGGLKLDRRRRLARRLRTFAWGGRPWSRATGPSAAKLGMASSERRDSCSASEQIRRVGGRGCAVQARGSDLLVPGGGRLGSSNVDVDDWCVGPSRAGNDIMVRGKTNNCPGRPDHRCAAAAGYTPTGGQSRVGGLGAGRVSCVAGRAALCWSS